MATAGKGLPFIGKMNEFLDRVLHPTVQKIGHSRAAMEVIHKGYYSLNPVSTTPLIVEAGSTDNILKYTAHGFKPGDVIQLVSTANAIKEFEIVVDEIIDVDNVILAGYLSDTLTAGDTFNALRPISERFDSTGATLAVVASPPISYNRKAAGTTTQTQVLEDLDTPTNSRALPVVIHSIDGAPIIVNAGDLSVSVSHVNDSVSIGDGTTLAAITLANELKTSDAGVEAELVTLNAKDFATQATLAAIETNQTDGTQLTKITDGAGTVNTKQIGTAIIDSDVGLITQSVIHGHSTAGGGTYVDVKVTPSGALTTETAVISSALPTGAATEATLALIKAKTDNLDVALSTRNAEATQALIKAKTDNLDVALSTVAKEVTQLAGNVLIGAVNEAAPASDIASSGLNGRLQRIAQNISSLITQLPATLGIKTAAASLSVAPASDAIFNTKPKAVTGSYAENLTLTTVATFTAPANAIGAIVQADDANAASFRAKQGAAATATSGIQFQAGRSEEFKSGTDISVCSEGASVKVYVQWFIQA